MRETPGVWVAVAVLSSVHPAQGDAPARVDPKALSLAFDASLRSLQPCRAQYAGVDPHVPADCYGDALITLLARYPDVFRAREAEALTAYVDTRPTITADAAARNRLLWLTGPPGAGLMHALAAAQSQASAVLYARQADAARSHAGSTVITVDRPRPPSRGSGQEVLWVNDYARADAAVRRAFGQVEHMTTTGEGQSSSIEVAAAGARYQRWQRQHLGFDQLLAALPTGSVYVEFVQYQALGSIDPDRFGKENLFRLPRQDGEPRYFAFAVWKDGAKLRVSSTDIGRVTDVDNQILTLRESIARLRPLGDLSAQLYRALLGHFDGAVRTARQLVISPAGTLHVLPFEVLQLDGDTYLGDHSTILYGNVRDVLADELMAAWQDNQPTAPGVIFADPDYGGEQPAPGPSVEPCGAGQPRGLQIVGPPFPPRFQRLPCTASEAAAIARQSRDRVEILSGAGATETELRRRERPEFLHFATHAFVLDSPTIRIDSRLHTHEDLPTRSLELELLVDPLSAAAIALAGANRRSPAAQTAPTVDDGLLAAAEAQHLNLGGTRLVVMSACETGKGVPAAGGAFYGLRHAFRSAGAAAVVGSLWNVNDDTTSWFMESFYTRFFAGEAPAVALQAARRDLRQKCPSCAHPYFWAAFVMEGAAVALRPRRATPR